ncbi:adenylyltransferase/cytidyltransferase family protein [Candidatus Pacearchaeota archaeon]|nr:adenylyltransferase/cytidyltransferase family protein [Candidatus Pacearchaeota archaeon]
MTIVSYEDLPTIREKYKDKKIICCTGVFDLTHAGHILFFEDCKKHGDILVVLVGRDSFIKSYKGKDRPILNEHIRLKTIDSLKPVDYVILDTREKFEEGKEIEGVTSVLPILKPDVYAINGEVPNIEGRKSEVEKLGVKFIVLDRACPKEFENISTTKIIEKIRRSPS